MDVDISCPRCKKGIKVKIREMVPGRKINCNFCRAEIEFSGDDGRKVQNSLNSLERTLKNFGK